MRIDPELHSAIVTGRKSLWISVGAFLVLLTVGIALLWPSGELPFDSALWKHQSRLRPRMIDSLLKQHSLLGMPRQEVDALLGKPTDRDANRAGNYIYWAGRAGMIDDRWLEIDFEHDIVTATRYVPD